MIQGEHSAILSIFIKLPFVIKIFVLSIFEWPLYTSFTVVFFFCLNRYLLFHVVRRYYWAYRVCTGSSKPSLLFKSALTSTLSFVCIHECFL